MSPIGVVHSGFTQQAGTPIQSIMAEEAPGVLEIFPEFQEGLADLDGFSHIMVFFHLHAVSVGALKVRPYLDVVERGIFSTRSPKRPNRLGMSVVRLDRIESGRLFIRGVDMLDGSPILDIKPYIPAFDHHPVERIGWYQSRLGQTAPVKADDRFAESPHLDQLSGVIIGICESREVGTAKSPRKSGEFIAGAGLAGDAHAGTVRPVSLLMEEDVAAFNRAHALMAKPGDFAENLLTRGLDLLAVHVGDQLHIGTAQLEVVQIGKEVLPHHYSFHGHRLLPTRGVFCRVLTGGNVAEGSAISVRKKEEA